MTDLLTDATMATSGLITVVVNTDGTVSFALPRAEVGQGITTAVAMASPKRWTSRSTRSTSRSPTPARSCVLNQLTGGSNSMHSIYTPVRVGRRDRPRAADQTAAAILGGTGRRATPSRDGVITAPDGTAVYVRATLAERAAVSKQHDRSSRS